MRPNWIPSTDQYTEIIPALNRMLGSWNCDGWKIFTSKIETFPLTSGVKTYTIGPGGAFNTVRPLYYNLANILYPTSPVVRKPVQILYNDEEWASITVQDIPGAPSWYMYPDMANPLTTIYLYPQPPAGYTLEIYTWQATAAFVLISDTVVLPPGYEEAIVWNLGVRMAAMYPHQSKLAPGAEKLAQKSLRAITTLNMRTPALHTDPSLAREWGNGYGWLDGGIR